MLRAPGPERRAGRVCAQTPLLPGTLCPLNRAGTGGTRATATGTAAARTPAGTLSAAETRTETAAGGGGGAGQAGRAAVTAHAQVFSPVWLLTASPPAGVTWEAEAGAAEARKPGRSSEGGRLLPHPSLWKFRHAPTSPDSEARQ